MKKTGILITALFALASLAGDIPEGHRERLQSEMEAFLTERRWAPRISRPGPGRGFQNWCKNYAQTNGIAFSNVVFLIQDKVELEHEAFRNNEPPPPDEGLGRTRQERFHTSIEMLLYLNDPVSLPFLYRMSRKAEGYYRKVFEDMFYETVEKSPAAAIREVLDTDEKLAADASRLARALMNHVFEPKYTADELLQKMMPRIMEGLRNGEKYFQVDPEMMDRDPGERYAVDELLLMIVPSIRDGETALRVDRNLCFRYPEYRTSVQRLVVCAFIEQCEPPVDWDEESRKPALAQKAELAELAATPPEQRTDMRQRFKNLPAPAPAEKVE